MSATFHILRRRREAEAKAKAEAKVESFTNETVEKAQEQPKAKKNAKK